MKLLYTCSDRATDPHLWSGVVFNFQRALEGAGVELAVLDGIPFECPLHLRLRHQLCKRLGRKTHYLQIEPAILQRAAKRIEARFAQGDCAAVFSPGAGVPVHSFLPASLPVFTYLDATKLSWIRAYVGLESLCLRSRRHVDVVDRTSLHNNTMTFFASEWAMREAADDYGVPSDRMAVVPFGANLTEIPSRADVAGWIAARPRHTLRLLFIGKEWERKGGPEALELVRCLHHHGMPTTLDIVGCSPELTDTDKMFARVHGFVDHSAPDGRNLVHGLLREAHMLIFLSRAEAFGIALCEAAAFGVPAFATNVGGIPTIVRHGTTGWLSETPFSASDAALSLLTIMKSPGEYQHVALGARSAFETRLNWTVAGHSLRRHIEQKLSPGAATRHP